ncbi:MAG: hypothetical protein IJ856_06450 [Candidatus Methanomethylophilaceae archaeon]|nr:hypothetical protein [Candidatus Methanomethylophilaceae archaeon]
MNIPTGIPLVYVFDEDFKVVSKDYVGDPEDIARRIGAVASQAKAR